MMSRMIKVMMIGCLHCWCNVGFAVDDVMFNLEGSRMNFFKSFGGNVNRRCARRYEIT